MKYTTTQAAEKLGISRSWLRHMIAGGKIHAEKVGRDWLIEEDIIATLVVESSTPDQPIKKGRPRGGGRMD